MKLRHSVLVTAALLSAFAISGTALAQRGGGFSGGHSGGHGGWHSGHGFGGVGAFIGGTIIAGALLAPWYYPGYYSGYYPRYYPGYYPGYYDTPYPTVVEMAAPAPTVYAEQPREAQPAAPDAGSWWYYCNESRAYYPYVRECASPWQRVAPTPPAAR
jgi:hypothetical protein